MTAPVAFAADGMITINGSVTGQTCTINGNGTGASSFLVTLPTVSTSALKSAGQRAGATPIRIELTECTPGASNVHVLFEPGFSTDMGTGNLKLDAGGATNVQIGLANQDPAFTIIHLGVADAEQNSKSVSIVDGSAELKYIAEYVATGPAGPGPARSRVLYTLVYQ